MNTTTRKLMCTSLVLTACCSLAPLAIARQGYISTKIDANPGSVKFRKIVTMTARLKQFPSNKPIAGVGVNVSLVFPYYRVALGPRYTDNNGNLSAAINCSPNDIPAPGTYYVAWTFPGNGVYKPTETVTTLTVTK